MVTSKLPPERDRISIGLLLVTDGSFHFNPYATNGLSHPYHLDEPTSILGHSDYFRFIFSMKIM